MAERRCFTMKIVDSDAFLEMPLTTQCLYFHLAMRADDDGFVNSPKRISKLIGTSDDDMKLLIAKRFVLACENGVIVIKHWRMHNTLKNDRIKDPLYPDVAARIYVKPNGAYTDSPEEGFPSLLEVKKQGKPTIKISDKSVGFQMDSKWIPNGTLREGKGIEEKGRELNRTEPNRTERNGTEDAACAALPPSPAKQERHKYGQYQNVLLSDDELEKLKAEFPNEWQERIERLSGYIASKGAKYKNHLATIRNWAKMDKERAKASAGHPPCVNPDDDNLDGIL